MFEAEGSTSAKALRQGQVLAHQAGEQENRNRTPRDTGATPEFTAQEGTSLKGRGGRKPRWELSDNLSKG